MVEILVEGASNCLTVEGWGCNGFEIVQPVVVRTNTGVGVGLKLNHKETSTQSIEFWAPKGNPDLITCWRAMKLLEYMQHIEKSNLEDAYYAALRHQRREYAQKADRVIGQLHLISPLGFHFYYYVLDKKIPEEIVGLIIQLWDEGVQSEPESIAEEMRVGKITWRDEFARMGLQKPRTNRPRRMFGWLRG